MTLACLAPFDALAQQPGAVFIRAGVSYPVGDSFGMLGDYRLWSGISLIASMRKWSPEVGCTELSPSPCSPSGVSLGGGVRLTAESEGGWWPFLQFVGGSHRYSSAGRWSPYVEGVAGIGWYVGNNVSIEGGVIVEQVRAGQSAWSAEFPSLRPANPHHVVTALSLMIGVRAR